MFGYLPSKFCRIRPMSTQTWRQMQQTGINEDELPQMKPLPKFAVTSFDSVERIR
jgi:hypothetical protein